VVLFYHFTTILFKVHVTHEIFFSILRLKDIFGPWMSLGQGKLLTKHDTRYIRFFRAYIGWVLKPMSQNYQISQYFFIAMLCAKMSRVT